MRAGSEPTSSSVSANAEMAPLASRGRKRFFCSVGAEHLDRAGHADRLVRREQRDERARSRSRPATWRGSRCTATGPSPPYSRGILMPNAPISRRPWTTASGMRASRSITSPSTFVAQEALELLEERLGALLLLGVGLGPRMDQRQVQLAEEQFAHERRRFPRGLARALGDGAGFGLGNVNLLGIAHGVLEGCSGGTPSWRLPAPRLYAFRARGRHRAKGMAGPACPPCFRPEWTVPEAPSAGRCRRR